ncbi:MAG: DUF2848 family protein [Deltaproteobacteria bacterium]|nr:DUF2848 family protein [Deltaproteobacteria bacterium]
MTTLELHLQKKNKSAPVQFRVKKMINAGYVGRDTSAVKAHIDELQREGVSPPPSVPMIFPVLSQNITTSDRIEVLGNKTSGEAEYVLLLEGDRLYVGVGSDHTDRDLETYSIVHSKQVCHNVMSANVWDYSDIQDYWDELVIQSWVKTGVFEEEILYQKASLGTIISAEDLIALGLFSPGPSPYSPVKWYTVIIFAANSLIPEQGHPLPVNTESNQWTISKVKSFDKAIVPFSSKIFTP